MRHTALLLAGTAMVCLAATTPSRAAGAAAVDARAPLFEAESTAGPIRLIDYRGKKNVLLAFYFKDFTSG